MVSPDFRLWPALRKAGLNLDKVSEPFVYRNRGLWLYNLKSRKKSVSVQMFIDELAKKYIGQLPIKLAKPAK